MTLGRNAGDTFVIGVATIGLFTLRAIDGREQEALAGYREAIELFARTGYWTHQWITLRNLAILLRRLGDVETAEIIEAAADVAPDAPATPATSRQLVTLTTDRSPDSVVRPSARSGTGRDPRHRPAGDRATPQPILSSGRRGLGSPHAQ